MKDEKDKVYSIDVALNIVLPEFFEELATFNSLELSDKQKTIRKNLKDIQLDIRNTINLLDGTINLEKVEQTPTDYVGSVTK